MEYKLGLNSKLPSFMEQEKKDSCKKLDLKDNSYKGKDQDQENQDDFQELDLKRYPFKGLNSKLSSFVDLEKKDSLKNLDLENNSHKAVSSLTKNVPPDDFSYLFKVQNKNSINMDVFETNSSEEKSIEKESSPDISNFLTEIRKKNFDTNSSRRKSLENDISNFLTEKKKSNFDTNSPREKREEDEALSEIFNFLTEKKKRNLEICMARKIKDQLNISPESPTDVLIKKRKEKKKGGFSSNSARQETKSSKIVSDYLKKMKSIRPSSPSSFGDDEASDDYSFQSGHNKKRKAVDFNKHVDQNYPPERILSPLENHKIRKYRPIIKTPMCQEKQAAEKEMNKHKTGPPKRKPVKNYSHLPIAEQVCYEVMDSFLSMNVKGGRRKVVTKTCDLSKLR